jgi:amino acid transporter
VATPRPAPAKRIRSRAQPAQSEEGRKVESGSMAAPAPAHGVPAGSAPGEKGLKTGALGFVSNVVIGVASTAPGYSLAASLGLVVAVAGIGLQSPAILLSAFVPMLFIAAAYYYMNRADPDCGTTFSWVTRAMGPWAGWLGGWAIIVADVIVMANLAQIAGLYSFRLFDWQSAADSTTAVTAVGVVWIAIMTAICVYGIELSARTQVGLLGAELLTLTIFAVVALIKVAAGHAGPNAVDPSFSWISPFAVNSTDAFVSGVLLSVFIYWGWDSTVTVNEESENSSETPGKAAVASTVILLATYVIVAIAAQAFNGPKELADNSDDIFSALGTAVLGSPLDKLLIIAVLTSAAASTQTTILPTARTSLSMARAGAMPESLGRIHPRFLTPHISTMLMGALSIVWYVGLTIVSENILFDSIAALGLMIAFYYGLTGFACVVYYRRHLLDSVRTFVMIGVLPFLGGLMLLGILAKSCYDLSKPENSESGDSWLGLGPPLIIGIGSMLLGVLLMLWWYWSGHREFFRRRTEVVDAATFAAAPASGAEV